MLAVKSLVKEMQEIRIVVGSVIKGKEAKGWSDVWKETS